MASRSTRIKQVKTARAVSLNHDVQTADAQRAASPSGIQRAVGVLDRVRVGVVIPAYCAQSTVAAVIARLPSGIRDIFIVDDASVDETAGVVEKLADPRVRLIRHERNRGVGGAMKSGYQAALDAGCDVIVKVDADDQMDTSFLPQLVRPLVTGEAGYAKGNRLWSLSSARSMPRRRLFGNLLLSMATKAVSGYWNVLDPTNGFTAIRADVLRRLDWSHVQDRYFFETSMLTELHLLRIPVRDVFMPARYDGAKSSLRIVPTVFEFSARLFAAFFRRLVLEYVLLDIRPGTIFGASGLALILGGGGFGVYHWYHGIVIGESSLPGTVMVAALPFIVGVQLFLQAILLDISEVRNFGPLPPMD
jgi:dolichol-phosphate mannosyltransferase